MWLGAGQQQKNPCPRFRDKSCYSCGTTLIGDVRPLCARTDMRSQLITGRVPVGSYWAFGLLLRPHGSIGYPPPYRAFTTTRLSAISARYLLTPTQRFACCCQTEYHGNPRPVKSIYWISLLFIQIVNREGRISRSLRHK